MPRGPDQWYARGLLGAASRLLEMLQDGEKISEEAMREVKMSYQYLGEVIARHVASELAKPAANSSPQTK